MYPTFTRVDKLTEKRYRTKSYMVFIKIIWICSQMAIWNAFFFLSFFLFFLFYIHCTKIRLLCQVYAISRQVNALFKFKHLFAYTIRAMYKYDNNATYHITPLFCLHSIVYRFTFNILCFLRCCCCYTSQ